MSGGCGSSGFSSYLSIAFSIGMWIYNLFTAKKAEKPKPQELSMTNYTRNAPVPICWGTNKYAGTVIYAANNGIQYYDGSSKGGVMGSIIPQGGAGTSDSYIYNADFAVAFSEGEIKAFVNMFFDGSFAVDQSYLDMEEFLGTSDQDIPTIGSLDYPARNTAYLMFSGRLGSMNQIPNLNVEVDGINIGDDDILFDWELDNDMTSLLPTDEGDYRSFSDGKYIYFIMQNTGKIFKFDDSDYSLTLIKDENEISKGFVNGNFLTCNKFNDDNLLYLLTQRNIENLSNPSDYDTFYDIFMFNKKTTEFTSICMDKSVPQTVPICKTYTYTITSVSGYKLYCNWNDNDVSSYGSMGFSGINYFFKIFLKSRDTEPPYAKFLLVEGQPSIPSNLNQITTYSSDPSGTIYNCGNNSGSGRYLRFLTMINFSENNNTYSFRVENGSVKNKIYADFSEYGAGFFDGYSGYMIKDSGNIDFNITEQTENYIIIEPELSFIPRTSDYFTINKLDGDNGSFIVCSYNSISQYSSIFGIDENGDFLATTFLYNTRSGYSGSDYYAPTIAKQGNTLAISFQGYYDTYYYGVKSTGFHFFFVGSVSPWCIMGFYGAYGYGAQNNTGKCPLYGPVYLNGRNYFLYYDNYTVGEENVKLLSYSLSDNFDSWDFNFANVIFEKSINPVFYSYPTANNSLGIIGIYNNRLYFDINEAYTPGSIAETHSIYCMYENQIVLIDKLNIFPQTQTQYSSYWEPYFIACGQRILFGNLHDLFLVKDFIPYELTPIAVCYDFLTNERYGCGIDSNLIDGGINTPDTSFYNEHRYCLENIGTGNEWDFRFLYSDVILNIKKGYDIIEEILQTCGGFIYYCDGKIKVKIPKPEETPSFYFGYHVQEFTSNQESDDLNKIYADFSDYPDDYWNGDFGKALIGDEYIDFIVINTTSTYIEILDNLDDYFPDITNFQLTKDNIKNGTFTWEKREERSKNNKININFCNREDDYRTDVAEATNDYSTLVEDEVREESFDMPGIKRISQAYRLAYYLLDYDTYTDYKCEFQTDIIGMMLCIGDIVGVTVESMSWVGKLFRIVSMEELEDYEVRLSLMEYNQDIYYSLNYNLDNIGDIISDHNKYNNNPIGDKYEIPDQCERLSLFEDRYANRVYILYSLPENCSSCMGARVYYKNEYMETWEDIGISYTSTVSVELLNDIDEYDDIIYFDVNTLYESFPTQGTFIIDDEEISYNGIDYFNYCFTNCVRGYNDTVPVSHSNGAYIYYRNSNLFYYEYSEDDLIKNPFSFKIITVTNYGIYATDGTPPEASIDIKGFYFKPLPVSGLNFSINNLSDIPSNCVALLHANGNNNYFYNEGFPSDSSNLIFTKISTPSYSSEQVKFGDYSIKFGSNKALKLSGNNDFNFELNDFTIDFWVYMLSNGTQGFITTWNLNNINSWSIINSFAAFYADNHNLQVRLSTALDLNQWVHLAYIRYENVLTLYKNGISMSTKDVTGIKINSYSSSNTLNQNLIVGRYYDDFESYSINGYMDCVRIINGTAIWTSNFTPPTSRIQTIFDFSWQCRSQYPQKQGYGHELYGGDLGYGGGTSYDIKNYAYSIMNKNTNQLLESGFVEKVSDTDCDGLLTYTGYNSNLQIDVCQINNSGVYSETKSASVFR